MQREVNNGMPNARKEVRLKKEEHVLNSVSL